MGIQREWGVLGVDASRSGSDEGLLSRGLGEGVEGDRKES
jgi:hypothetical protein